MMKDFFGLGLLPIVASTDGNAIDQVLVIVHILMLLLFVGWMSYFFYAVWTFAASRHPKADYHGVQGHFSSYIELGVILFEVVLLVGFSIPMVHTILNKFPPAEKAINVRVVAEQFAWNFHYSGPDGKFGKADKSYVNPQSNPLGLDPADPEGADDIVTQVLKLPIDQPVIANVTSKDVIHAFGIPVMRVKTDAIPGTMIPVAFTPNRVGKYLIACSQLCGTGHAVMRGFIEILPREEFDGWYRKISNLNASARQAPKTVASVQ